MLKYLKRYKEPSKLFGNDWKEVTYDEALNTLLGTYRDNNITRELLTQENVIPCMLSEIMVVEE